MQVPLRDDQTHDLDAMAEAITERTRLIFVCTPNNPTGTVVAADRARRASWRRVPDDVLVIVDEAYVEFVRDADAVRGLETYRDRPNVAVLRTFSKAYGLAGLRVGFAVAHPHGGRTPCGRPRCRSGCRRWRRPPRSRRSPPRTRCSSGSTRSSPSAPGSRPRSPTQGWVLPPSQANFVWLRPGERIGEFVEACEAVNLSVRRYADDGVRITIGEVEANDRFLGVSARFV